MNVTLQNKNLSTFYTFPPCKALYLQLLGEVVSHYGSERRKQRSQEDANITDVNSNVEKV